MDRFARTKERKESKKKKHYNGKSCKNVTGMERVARKSEKIIN